VRPAASELLPAARLGDELLLLGSALTLADTTVGFEHVRGGPSPVLVPTGVDEATRMHLSLPGVDDPGALGDWQVGMYSVRLRRAAAGMPATLSNAVALPLSPSIVVSPLVAPAGDVALSVECRPRLLPAQAAGVRLLFGNREVAPDSLDTPVDPAQPTSLQFTVTAATAGSHPVRLRVDGLDSLPVRVGADGGFEFDPLQTVVVA